MSIEDHFITRQEALRLFASTGLSEPTFTRKVADGTIESYLPEGRKRGSLYRKDHILKIVRKNEDKKRKKSPQKSVIKFRRMNRDEMPIVADILNELFDGYPNIEQWQDRIRANPDIGYVVTDDEVIVGCGFIMPHSEAKILDIFPREETPPTFPHEIPAYAERLHTCLYLRSVGVRQSEGISPRKRKIWAQILILGLLKEIVKLGDRGVFIDKIYARSDTSKGELMLHRLGFTRLKTTTSHENFVIDVESSGITFVKQYNAALIVWRKKNEGA